MDIVPFADDELLLGLSRGPDDCITVLAWVFEADQGSADFIVQILVAGGRLRTNVAAELRLARTPRGTRPKGLVAPEVQALLRAAGQSRRALARRNYAVVQLLLAKAKISAK